MATVRPRIAVVDDEESVRRALARMLGASHFEVDVFASGQEFLDSLRTRLPECVILDYQMRGLTGRDVQRQLTLAQGRRRRDQLKSELSRHAGVPRPLPGKSYLSISRSVAYGNRPLRFSAQRRGR